MSSRLYAQSAARTDENQGLSRRWERNKPAVDGDLFIYLVICRFLRKKRLPANYYTEPDVFSRWLREELSLRVGIKTRRTYKVLETKDVRVS